ncbi:MAG TPA: S8 family serine peptidase [Opitutaceae bacterium]|nr:S8 family serine peptidase [Opitutaceae bacterium]
MSKRSFHFVTFAGGCLAALLLWLWLTLRSGDKNHGSTGELPAAAAEPHPGPAGPTVAGTAPGTVPYRDLLRRPVLPHLQEMLEKKGARPHEAVLIFSNADAYRRFLARAHQSGLTVIGQLDGLLAIRIRYDSLAGLQADMLANPSDYADVSANFYVNIPEAPAKEDRPAVNLVPLGNNLLTFLGVNGDPGQWGRGVTIAVLDSGVAADRTFGTGRVRVLDIGLGATPGTGSEDGHGTAVAALAAGMAADAPGVAPAANILSIRVTDANAQSDVFTLSQAILAAVDSGAQIINISLGGYDTTSLLDNAITYASQRGVVVVASAGNDQAAQLTWPAADPRVVSVGAVDALGQQVTFSNSGSQLQLTAPGYGVQTAWLDGQRVDFDGTSASAPIVAGAIAALVSTNPGMTAMQAWQVLQQYASDGGAPGPDSDYGNGVLNLGWAMNRNDPTRIDTAVSSHYYDAASGQMEFVVQNRSGQSIAGMILNVDTGANTAAYSIPLLTPGGSYVVRMPIDPGQLAAAGTMVFRTQLNNPAGIVDQVPANNRRTSSLTAPAK